MKVYFVNRYSGWGGGEIALLDHALDLRARGHTPIVALRGSEECFLAESDCVVLGTCAENPEAKSEEDRIMICQGENEKTFIISTQTEVKLGRSIRNNALIMFLLAVVLIVGGFALALHGGGLL